MSQNNEAPKRKSFGQDVLKLLLLMASFVAVGFIVNAIL
jgi:hypothetical protein